MMKTYFASLVHVEQNDTKISSTVLISLLKNNFACHSISSICAEGFALKMLIRS